MNETSRVNDSEGLISCLVHKILAVPAMGGGNAKEGKGFRTGGRPGGC